MKKCQIGMIVAMSQNRVIGVNGVIPWHCPEDLEHFKYMTENEVVIMGRKTFESMTKPLKNRINIVVSRYMQEKDLPDEVIVMRSLKEAIHLAKGFGKTIWLIGGESIYREGMKYADWITITEIGANIEQVRDMTMMISTTDPESNGDDPWYRVLTSKGDTKLTMFPEVPKYMFKDVTKKMFQGSPDRFKISKGDNWHIGYRYIHMQRRTLALPISKYLA